MLSKKFGVILSIALSCLMPLQAFAKTDNDLVKEYAEQGIECYELNTSEVVDTYLIDDENDNVIYHKVTVLADGTELHDTIERISSITKSDGQVISGLSLKSNPIKGSRDETFRHKVKGYNEGRKYYAYAEFDFEIKYEWDSKTSAVTYAYCENVTQGFTQMDDIGRKNNQAWAKYIDLSRTVKTKYLYTVDKYGNVDVDESNSL